MYLKPKNLWYIPFTGLNGDQLGVNLEKHVGKGGAEERTINVMVARRTRLVNIFTARTVEFDAVNGELIR